MWYVWWVILVVCIVYWGWPMPQASQASQACALSYTFSQLWQNSGYNSVTCTNEGCTLECLPGPNPCVSRVLEVYNLRVGTTNVPARTDGQTRIIVAINCTGGPLTCTGSGGNSASILVEGISPEGIGPGEVRTFVCT